MHNGRTIAALSLLVVAGCVDQSQSSSLRRAETGCPPLQLLEKALCVCEDFNDVGKVNVGPYRHGPYGMNYPYDDAGGSVGVNGMSTHTALVGASGTWEAWGGLSTTGDFIVGQDLVTPASLSYQGAVRVNGDLVVGGDLTGTGQLIVDGTLSLGGENMARGMQRVGAEADYAAPSGPPCPCDPATFFDVAAAVESARISNDNALRGIPQDISLFKGDELRLPTGRYFFSNLESQGKVVVVIEGTVAIYLAGSLDTVGYANFRLEDGAQLDLFVAGNIRTVGHVDMAQEGYHGAGHGWPYSRFRLYVGGEDPIMMVTGNQFWGGSIYAPKAALKFTGHFMVNGSLFVRTFEGTGHLEVYGGMIIPPDSCPEASDVPDSSNPTGDPDVPSTSNPVPGDPDVPSTSNPPSDSDSPEKVDCYNDPNNPLCVVD